MSKLKERCSVDSKYAIDDTVLPMKRGKFISGWGIKGSYLIIRWEGLVKGTELSDYLQKTGLSNYILNKAGWEPDFLICDLNTQKMCGTEVPRYFVLETP